MQLQPAAAKASPETRAGMFAILAELVSFFFLRSAHQVHLYPVPLNRTSIEATLPRHTNSTWPSTSHKVFCFFFIAVCMAIIPCPTAEHGPLYVMLSAVGRSSAGSRLASKASERGDCMGTHRPCELHHVVAAGGLPPLRICMVLLGVHRRGEPTGCDNMVYVSQKFFKEEEWDAGRPSANLNIGRARRV